MYRLLLGVISRCAASSSRDVRSGTSESVQGVRRHRGGPRTGSCARPRGAGRGPSPPALPTLSRSPPPVFQALGNDGPGDRGEVEVSLVYEPEWTACSVPPRSWGAWRTSSNVRLKSLAGAWR